MQTSRFLFGPTGPRTPEDPKCWPALGAKSSPVVLGAQGQNALHVVMPVDKL